MKKAMWFFGVGVMMAELAFGGGVPLIDGDSFNDNAINWSKWSRITGENSRLRELNKHLYYDNGGYAGYTIAHLIWDYTYTLFPGDTLQVSALVNVPMVTISNVAIAHGIGLGFMSGGGSSAKWLRVYAESYNYSRKLVVETLGLGASNVSTALIFPLPDTRFYLIMRYNATTGKVAIWQQSLDLTQKIKVKVINLNANWNIPLGSSLGLQPLIYAVSSGFSRTPADNLWADRFSVQMTVPE